MRNLVLFILISVNTLIACTDTNDYSRTFQYVIKHKFHKTLTLVLYDDSVKRNELKRLMFNEGDSVLIYECSRLTSEGFCSPFDGSNSDEIKANYGQLIFDDKKKLEFNRFQDKVFNILSGSRYDEPFKVSDRLFIETYSVEESDYLLAK